MRTAAAIPPELAGELAQVLAAYGLPDTARPVHGGLINQTFVIPAPAGAAQAAAPAAAIVQRLHPIFGAEVNIDIDAVTAHLAACGMETPRLLRTRDNGRWVETDGGVWRALSYVAGTTLHRIDDPATARAAGELVGRFHRAVDSLAHEYVFVRAGVHDTEAHLDRLRDRLRAPAQAAAPAPDRPAGRPDDLHVGAARALGEDILAAAASLPVLPALPLRHTHGDLKISNLLFSPGDSRRARCLVDLDTLGRQTIAYELGDALRSWCNPHGEDTPEVHVDEDILAAAMAGYRAGAGDLLAAAERESIVPGLETVCVELAARFCVDVFDDAYFGWDPDRFSSRREHDLVRARGQLALARSVRARRGQLARHV